MKLIDAMRIVQAPAPEGAEPMSVALACGFTPDQFRTLLAAHMRNAKPKRTVEATAGLFGDLVGNLERFAASSAKAPDAIVVPVEWSDLDDRLGLRRLGGWLPEALGDIVETATTRLSRIEAAASRLATSSVVALSLPTLPLPPVSYLPPNQAGMFETQLRAAVASAAARLAAVERVRIVDTQAIDRTSPPSQRLDVRAELNYGYPYQTPHASALASIFASLIDPPPPKKGLVTDLDDTFWKGLVGEIGPGQIAWDLDGHAQIHGLYQQMLRSLASAGVLLAVASKNDPGRVEEAFRRSDLHVQSGHFFPMEVSWGPKSQAIARILAAWNVGADSIVFVDDSPLELAEVKAAHPEVECILFPKTDDAAAYALVEHLRARFGKVALGAEDAVRLESLRRGAEVRAGLETSDPGAFLSTIDAVIEIADERDPSNRRPFELINKTNQFNLNGRRVSEAAWLAHLADPDGFVLGIAYRDKFGPLGTIGVITGRRDGSSLRIGSWVMSCRAFSRQIEHRTLSLLLERFGTDEIVLDYEKTAKNEPTQEFIRGYLDAGAEPDPGLRLSRQRIEAAGPRTFHRIEEKTHG